MNESNLNQWNPVKDKAWRTGFFFLVAVTALAFAGSYLYLESARQAALQMDTTWLTIGIANSHLPFMFGTAMMALVLSTVTLFVANHPRSRQKDIINILAINFIIFMYLGLLWFQRIMLAGQLDYSVNPPQYPLLVLYLELPINITSSLITTFVPVFLAVIVWFRWLRPSSWEPAENKVTPIPG